MSPTVKLTKNQLKSLLKKVAESSLTAELERHALQEKDKQDALASASQPEQAQQQTQPGDETSNVDNQPKDDNVEKSNDEEKEVDLQMIIDKLNTIRSGHSFKDEVVGLEMKRYFEDLEPSERMALYAFLKGISQIVTGVIDGEDAMEPNDAPDPGVKITPKTDNNAKAPSGMKVIKHVSSEKKSGAENNASPVPITPKKR